MVNDPLMQYELFKAKQRDLWREAEQARRARAASPTPAGLLGQEVAVSDLTGLVERVLQHVWKRLGLPARAYGARSEVGRIGLHSGKARPATGLLPLAAGAATASCARPAGLAPGTSGGAGRSLRPAGTRGALPGTKRRSRSATACRAISHSAFQGGARQCRALPRNSFDHSRGSRRRRNPGRIN